MEFDATFLIASISFILFTFIMNKIFYLPVMKIMEERENYVAQNYKYSQETKIKIQSNTDLKNSKLEETRGEGRGIITQKSNEAKQQKNNEIKLAKQQSSDNITKMKEELINEAKKSQEILMKNAVDISKEISLTILGDTVNTDNITPDKIKRTEN